jgi:hypothetical protein
MTEIDAIASTLLEESKLFLEKARESAAVEDARNAYLHACVNLAFCSLEAHINSIADDQLLRTDISLHERGLLMERKVELVHGRYELQNGLQMYRLEDRLQFLWTRFSTEPEFDRKSTVWGHFKNGLEMRNSLTHPKEVVTLTIESAERTLRALIEIIDIAYMRIYKRHFPARGKDLNSTLSF